MRMLFLLAATVCFTLSSYAQEETVDPEAWNEILMSHRESTSPAENLRAVKIPILFSPKLEKKWGKPILEVSPDGSYTIQYTNPELSLEQVAIHGFVEPIPTLAKVPDFERNTVIDGDLGTVLDIQSWQVETVKMKTPEGKQEIFIRYFHQFDGSGADFSRDATDTIRITVGGVTGSYIVTVDPSDNARKQFSELQVTD